MLIDLQDCYPLRHARVHETCGAGALAFAGVTGAQAQGDVLWVREGWRRDMLNPVGLSLFFDPRRLLLVQAHNQTEVLAVAEEALRDGTLSLVVAEPGRPLGLTPGRRLQLAAEAGQTTGLCLTSEGMGSNAAETHWHCTPLHDTQALDSTLMHWELKKNKSGTCGAWNVRWDHAARRLDVVSPAGE